MTESTEGPVTVTPEGIVYIDAPLPATVLNEAYRMHAERERRAEGPATVTPHDVRLAKYGSTLTEDNVRNVVERIADYPEIVAAVRGLLAEGPATITLTDDERATLADWWAGDFEDLDIDSLTAVTASIVAARVDALTADLAAAEHMLNLVTEDGRRMRQVVANVRALAVELHEAAQAEVNRTDAALARRETYLRCAGSLRALLPAAPTGEGT